MGRPRKTGKHLPQRVVFKHGAFYYITKENKWLPLGKTFVEMMENYLKIIRDKIEPSNIICMNDVFDKYILEVSPKKAKRSYKNDLYGIKWLRIFFGEMVPTSITPVHIYEYRDLRAEKGRVTANRELSLLSHVFTMCVQWGKVTHNPCRDVKRFSEKPDDHDPTDEELLAVMGLADDFWQCVLDFAYLTLMRMTDILELELTDLTKDGINRILSKTGRKMIYEWSDDLVALMERIKNLPRPRECNKVFVNQRGKGYTMDGFSTMWQRLRNKALELGVLTRSFKFRHIRRKGAGKMEKEHGIECARQILGHATQQMTQRYLSLEKRVTPLKKLSNTTE